MASGLRGLRSVARDTFVLAAGGAAAAAIGFLVWLFLARTISASDYGALGAAMAFVALFYTAGDLGINYLAIREGSKEPARSAQLFRRLFGPKLLLIIGSTALCALLAFILPFRGTERLLILVQMWTIPALGAAGYIACFCNVHRRMARLGAIQTAERGAMALMTVTTISLGFGVVGAALSSIVSAALYFGIAGFATRRLRDGPLWPPAPLADARPLLPAAIQFGVAALLSTVHSKIDVVMLALLSDPGQLASYVAAAQLFSLVLLLASALSQAAFPWLVPQLAKGEIPLRRIALWSLGLAGLASGVALFASAVAPQLFSLFFPTPELAAGAPAFRILVWAFVPAIASVPVSLALDALDLQWVHVANAAGMAGLNVVANLMLIPVLGGIGAAWASVAAWWVGLVVGVPIALIVLSRHPSFSK